MTTNKKMVAEDGFWSTKAYSPESGKVIAETRVRPGTSTVSTLAKDLKSDLPAEYMTPGDTGTNDVYSVNPAQVENLNRTAYHGSAANRVMVHHALRLAGATPEDKIELAVGLPLSLYFTNMSKLIKNDELIDRKIASLMKPVYSTTKSARTGDVSAIDGDSLNIVSVDVYPQGVAAFYDLHLNEEIKDGRRSVSYDDEVASQMIGFVDIGGGTTDIVIISDGSISSHIPTPIASFDIGMHNVIRQYSDLLINHIGLSLAGVTDTKINASFASGELRVGGKNHDTSDCKTMAIRTVLADLIRQIDSAVSPVKDSIDRLIFIGGGSLSLKEELSAILKSDAYKYKNFEISKDPVFSNATGMYKMLKYFD